MTHSVVLIESQMDVAQPLMVALKEEGYEPVGHFYTVDGYLRDILASGAGDEHAPDCIIAAQELRGESALAFVDRIRTGRTDLPRSTPFILMGYLTDRRQIVIARDHGVDEICAKPVLPNNLLAKVRQVVNKPRPFVMTSRYVGPDRRRRRNGVTQTEDRRKSDHEPEDG